MSTFPFKKQLIASSVLLALIPNAHAEEEKKSFDEVVVVTGTRTEQSLSDVSASISKLTADELDKQGAQNLSDAVRYEPGVSVSNDGRFGAGSFNIRGMNGDRVKVIVDGVQQPRGYDPGGDAMKKGLNAFELDTLKAIEINKGPSSTLYGSDALGGTVYLKTKDAQDIVKENETGGVKLKTGYNSVNESYKATIEGAKIGESWDGLFIYTYREGKETQGHSSGADTTGHDRGQPDPLTFRSHNFLAKSNFYLNDSNKIGLIGEYFHKDSNVDLLSKEGTVSYGSVLSNVKGHDVDSKWRLALNHEWSANVALFDRLFWQASYQAGMSNHDTSDTKTSAGGAESRTRQRYNDDHTAQLDLQFDKTLQFEHGTHEITYGALYIQEGFDLNYKDISHTNGTSVDSAGEVPNAESQKRAVFIQDNIFLLDESLVINAGLRYEDYKAEPKSGAFANHNSDALTAKLGAVYHFNNNWSTFAQYAEGFRSPNLQELYYFRDGGNYLVTGNPNLKPEESKSYEIGLRSQTNASRMEIVGYYNDYKNFIQQVTDYPSNYPWGRTGYDNIDEAKIYGVEFKGHLLLDVAMGLPEGSYSRLSVAYSRGEDKNTGAAIDEVAPLTAVFGLGYDAPSTLWGSQANLKMVAAKQQGDWSNPNNDYAPGYALVDITAYYNPVRDLTLRAGLFNALDQKYWDYQDISGRTNTATQNKDFYTQPGRNWGVALEYAF